MLKTVSTLPYLAALLVATTAGLELVEPRADEHIPDTSPRARKQHGRSASTSGIGPLNRLARRLSSATYNPLPISLPSPTVERLREHESKDTLCAISKLDEAQRWQPVFVKSSGGLSIRRLYPSKTQSRPALCSATPQLLNSRALQSRRSSLSSAASVQQTPSPVAELSYKQSDIHSPLRNRFGRTHRRGPSLPVLDTLVEYSSSSLKRSKSFEIPEDPGYESLKIDHLQLIHDDDSPVPLVAQQDHDITLEVTRSTPIVKLHAISPSTGDRPMTASTLGRPDSARSANSFSKGHLRAKSSIASIWDFDLEESSPPPPIRRKPLQLHARPPLPNFVTPPTTAKESMRPPDKAPSRTSRRSVSSKWLETQHGEDALVVLPQTRSVSSKRHSTPSMQHAAESWDEDFSELSLEVPESIRETQATLRGHLWQLKQFADQIAELKFLQDKFYTATETCADVEEIRVWKETDAVIAIASQGDETSPSKTEYKHDPVHDSVIADILGFEPGYQGKVRLDGEVLETLVYKAEDLIGEICNRWLP